MNTDGIDAQHSLVLIATATQWIRCAHINFSEHIYTVIDQSKYAHTHERNLPEIRHERRILREQQAQVHREIQIVLWGNGQTWGLEQSA